MEKEYKLYDYLSRGSDERQYCSPGIDLPVGSLMRTKYGEYPEYHTSLDNFKLVTLRGCKGDFNVAKKSIEILLKRTYPQINPCQVPDPSFKNHTLRSSL